MVEKDRSPRPVDPYQILLLQEIIARVGRIEDHQLETKAEIASLKTKAGIWGTVGGTIAAGTMFMVAWIRGHANG